MPAPALAAAAAAALVLTPFGGADALLKSANPWHGFAGRDATLTVARLEKVERAPACAAWLSSLDRTADGADIGSISGPFDWPLAWKAWSPWSVRDRSGVTDCDDFPCKVKFNHAETQAMAAAGEKARLERFESLVAARTARFLKAGAEEFEFPGKPIDPWAVLDRDGFSYPEPTRPAALGRLRARAFNLSPGKMATLHQILETRTAKVPGRAALWTRAAYSDHYFDAWGEFLGVECVNDGSARILQTLVVEFDLMKKNDIFSKIARGRMRDAIEENGASYLDRIREKLIARPSPSAATVPAHGL